MMFLPKKLRMLARRIRVHVRRKIGYLYPRNILTLTDFEARARKELLDGTETRHGFECFAAAWSSCLAAL